MCINMLNDKITAPERSKERKKTYVCIACQLIDSSIIYNCKKIISAFLLFALTLLMFPVYIIYDQSSPRSPSILFCFQMFYNNEF